MTKAEMPLLRPRFKVQGVWKLGCNRVVCDVLLQLTTGYKYLGTRNHCAPGPARLHNTLLHLWVLHPNLPSDSSTIVETLSRSLELAVEACRGKHGRAPRQLLVWEPCLHK